MTAYLDRALAGLRRVGIDFTRTPEPAPVLALLEQVRDYDQNRVTAIAQVLQQSSTFNALVREQLEGLDISTRFMDITEQFNSIRDDAQAMAGWMEDGKLDLGERIALNWMTLRRGSIPDRFGKIREAYMAVCESANRQIAREDGILTAYQDFRLALKTAEVDAQQVLEGAAQVLDQRRSTLQQANDTLAGSQAGGSVQAALELARDEAVRALQDEDRRYQIVKNIADDLKTGYNTAELVFARIAQTHAVKERMYQRMVSFFATNETVLSGLSASFTANSGLDESRRTLEATTEGIGKALETLGSAGNATLEAAMRASYGSTLKVDSVKALASATLDFQRDMQTLAEQHRAESTRAAQEIEAAVEDAKRQFAALLTRAA